MSEETPSIAAPEQNAIAETGSITARTSRGTIPVSYTHLTLPTILLV